MAGGIDEYTKLILHCDEDDKQQSLKDFSTSDHAVTCQNQCAAYRHPFTDGEGILYFSSGYRFNSPSDSDFDLTGTDFTVETYVFNNYNPISWPVDNGICGYRIDDNNAWGFWYDGANLRFTVVSGGATIIDISKATSLNQFTYYHLAVVKQGTSYEMFVDGTSIGTATDSDTIPSFSGGTFHLARKQNIVRPWQGHMAVLRISDNARYTTNFSKPTTKFTVDGNTKVLVQPKTTDNPTPFTDDTGHVFTSSGLPQAKLIKSVKKFGLGSLWKRFDSVSYFAIPDSDDWFLNGDWTIDFWFYPLYSTDDRVAGFSQRQDAANYIYVYPYNAGGNSDIFVNGESADTPFGVGIDWSPGFGSGEEWVHFEICRFGNTVYAFKDGDLLGTAPLSITFSNFSGEFRFPNITTSDGGVLSAMDGFYDEIRFSNGIARHIASFTPSTEPYSIELEEDGEISYDYLGSLKKDGSVVYKYAGFTETADGEMAYALNTLLDKTADLLFETDLEMHRDGELAYSRDLEVSKDARIVYEIQWVLYYHLTEHLDDGTYKFRVVAVDEVGNESTVKDISVTIDSFPEPVTNVVLEEIAGPKIKITWIDPTDSDLDKIYIYDNAGVDDAPPDWGTVVDQVSAGVQEWTSPVLANGGWGFGLRAVDSAGHIERNTDCHVLWIPDTEPPNKPGFPHEEIDRSDVGSTDLYVEARPNGGAYFSWAYFSDFSRPLPEDFAVYTDSGTGTIDYNTPLFTVAYSDGVNFYEHTESGLTAAEHEVWQFVIRARRASGTVNDGNTDVYTADLDGRAPAPVTSLNGEPVL